jgi:hypothetical protein
MAPTSARPNEEDLGPVAVEDGGGPVPVAMHQLGLVMPDAEQLDALAAAGGRPLGRNLRCSWTGAYR